MKGRRSAECLLCVSTPAPEEPAEGVRLAGNPRGPWERRVEVKVGRHGRGLSCHLNMLGLKVTRSYLSLKTRS